MEKVGEITREGTPDEIKAHLEAIHEQMKQVGAAIRTTGKNDYTLVLHNTTAMAAKQVYRLSTWLNAEHDMIAWAARNLLELDLLLRYALSSDENLKRLLADFFLDAIEINKGFMGLGENHPQNALYQQAIEAHYQEAARGGLTLEKTPVRTHELAKLFDLEAEYRAFHKVNSKYVHPTSWRLIGPTEMTNTIDIKNVFLAQAQLYALHILSVVCERTEVPQTVPWQVIVLPDPL